ncbi:hypothetical protein KDH_11510 [Dictyobacter sp. S3.2.2.5]|uniref:Uncharacterized protein n=1 Tax=Dictyobacter halimunensis TaxID=3026934 RepID=A0ABQ6FPF2_9CHLR|nr:hypothetical protein KDH_11510 [Dictyobacter sp. S3.2.2.5]
MWRERGQRLYTYSLIYRSLRFSNLSHHKSNNTYNWESDECPTSDKKADHHGDRG